MSTELRRLRASLADADQTMTAKARAVERAERDLKALEQEGFLETKKLRNKLKEVTNELESLKLSEIPRLRKDLEEANMSHGRLQSSNSATINGLIAEVNATEDALSKERKAREIESAQYQAKVRELQMNLERAQEIILEHSTKVSANSTEKTAHMNFLECEVERLKGVLSQRDDRLADLEKQQQTGRIAIQGYRDNQLNLESTLTEVRRQLECEVVARKSLEETIRHLQRSTDRSIGIDEVENRSQRYDEHNYYGSGPSKLRGYDKSSEIGSGRPISPIDVFTGGENIDNYDDYSSPAKETGVGTAVSSLSSSSIESSRYSPFVAKNTSATDHNSPSSTSSKRFFDRDRPTYETFRMSPVVEEHAVESVNTKHSRIYDIENADRKRVESSVVSRSADDALPRFQKSLKFIEQNDSDDYSFYQQDVDASVDEDAQDTINRTQLYLQQRLAHKNTLKLGNPQASSRLPSSRAAPLSYAAVADPQMEEQKTHGKYSSNQVDAGAGDSEGDDVIEYEADETNTEDADGNNIEREIARRRKKPVSKKISKKKRGVVKLELTGEPGNFHIQLPQTIKQSSSTDTLHFPQIAAKR